MSYRKKFRKSPYIYIKAAMLVDKRKAHQWIFPYHIIENFPLSTLSSLVQINSNLVQRHVVSFYRRYLNLGQIDYKFHNSDFRDVKCKNSNRPSYKIYHDCKFYGFVFSFSIFGHFLVKLFLLCETCNVLNKL